MQPLALITSKYYKRFCALKDRYNAELEEVENYKIDPELKKVIKRLFEAMDNLFQLEIDPAMLPKSKDLTLQLTRMMLSTLDLKLAMNRYPSDNQFIQDVHDFAKDCASSVLGAESESDTKRLIDDSVLYDLYKPDDITTPSSLNSARYSAVSIFNDLSEPREIEQEISNAKWLLIKSVVEAMSRSDEIDQNDDNKPETPLPPPDIGAEIIRDSIREIIDKQPELITKDCKCTISGVGRSNKIDEATKKQAFADDLEELKLLITKNNFLREQCLNGNPFEFLIICSESHPDGKLFYSSTVIKDDLLKDDWYEAFEDEGLLEDYDIKQCLKRIYDQAQDFMPTKKPVILINFEYNPINQPA